MALLQDELAVLTARAKVLRAGTGRAAAIEGAARLTTGGKLLWKRSIDPLHVATPYNQGQPPLAADTAVYTTYRS